MLSTTDTAALVLPLPRASIRYQTCKSVEPLSGDGASCTVSMIHNGGLILATAMREIRSAVCGSIPASWPWFSHQDKSLNSGLAGRLSEAWSFRPIQAVVQSSGAGPSRFNNQFSAKDRALSADCLACSDSRKLAVSLFCRMASAEADKPSRVNAVKKIRQSNNTAPFWVFNFADPVCHL